MKLLKFLPYIILALTLTFCKQKEEVKEKVKTVSIEIEGMTCQIGCAKLIESKLVKQNGVLDATVVFDNKKGTIQFDPNIVSEKQLVETIEKIADGDLYTVKKVSQVN